MHELNLENLPKPDAIEDLDYEVILDARNDSLIDLFPDDIREQIRDTLELESSPLPKLLEESSYRELVIRDRINECVRRVLLAFARGGDLDHIGARYYVERQVIQEADPDANPPVPEILESDNAFKERIQEAYEGLSIAGPRAAYIFHAHSADGRVMDAEAFSPDPSEVVVPILSHEDDGTASQDLIDTVYAALNDEEVRPLGDRLTVQSSIIVDYQVKAVLHMVSDGPGNDLARSTAEDRVSEWTSRRRRQGRSVWRSKLESLLHTEGVEHVELTSPASDIELDVTKAARCTGIDITMSIPDPVGDP